MSSLVSEFLINPVLRQARRFSRTSAISSQEDPLANPYDANGSRDEVTINEANETVHTGLGLEDGEATFFGSVPGTSIVSSPVDENGGLERELEMQRRTRNFSNPGSITSLSDIPRRLASFPPARIGVDDDATSANPAFGVPSRFDTSSPASSSYTNSTHNLRRSPVPRTSTMPQTTLQPTSSTGSRKRDSSLPEDDGMSDLRKRIISIRAMNLSASEKARMMQDLLTEGYSNTQINHNARPIPQAHSPVSLVSQDRPVTPVSLGSFSFWQTGSSNTPPDSSPTSSLRTFQLSPEDLESTFAPIEPLEATDSGDEVDRTPSLGCHHYKRNVKLQCFTCNRWYTCRHCHDEAENHVLNRKETRNMLCMLCKCAQRASEICVNCSARAAWYYCGVCHLWDDDTSKSIYHCNDCGICRIGRGIGKDFFHCKICDVCIKISNEFSHKCIERASDCDCPICGEYLFSSPKSVCFMKCGHSIHRTCYHALMETTYKCPICSQSAVNMESQFRHLDRSIADQPMPTQFQDTKAMISCNDCYAKSLVTYHWLGLKCAICDSYNTVQLRILTETDPNTEISAVSTVPVQEIEVPPAQIYSGNNLLPGSHHRLSESLGTSRSRRHSLIARPMSIPTQVGSSYFSPYVVPERIGRSVSPIRGNEFVDTPMVDAGDTASENEEELDFWGRNTPRSLNHVEDLAEEEDDSEDDSMSEDEEDDDDDDDDEDEDDDEDHMALFGHR